MLFAATQLTGQAHVSYLKSGLGPVDEPLHEGFLPQELPVCYLTEVTCLNTNAYHSIHNDSEETLNTKTITPTQEAYKTNNPNT